MPCPGVTTTGPVDSCPCQVGADDITNFMDGSPESCLLHFTCGQARRMHATYWQFRVGIMEEDKLLSLRSMVREVRANRTAGAAHGKDAMCVYVLQR
jgi:hypothetical protein